MNLNKAKESRSRRNRRKFPVPDMLEPELHQGSNDVSFADLNASNNSIPAIESQIEDNQIASTANKYRTDTRSPTKHESSTKWIANYGEEEKA